MRIAGIDSDLQVLLAAGVPARLLKILRKHAVRTFEGLLASIAEFKFATLKPDRVVNVVGDAAEWVSVGGHAVTQPQKVAAVNRESDQHEKDEATLHCFAGYLCLSCSATPTSRGNE